MGLSVYREEGGAWDLGKGKTLSTICEKLNFYKKMDSNTFVKNSTFIIVLEEAA